MEFRADLRENLEPIGAEQENVQAGLWKMCGFAIVPSSANDAF